MRYTSTREMVVYMTKGLLHTLLIDYSSIHHNNSSQHNIYINYLAFVLHQTMWLSPASVALYS